MKIKTATLIGPQLDWAVAKWEGKNGILHDDGITRCIVIAAPSGVYKGTWKPTANWSQGGPIIEREGISVIFHDNGAWTASNSNGKVCEEGVTSSIAAMRCFVASKLGDEVDVPEDLK
jgi:hypothetical protein